MIAIKIDMLEIDLFGYKLCEKIYASWSCLFRNRILEPWLVFFEIEIDNRVDVRVEKDFENNFTDVLYFVITITEAAKIDNLNRRIVLDDLSK